MVLLILCYHRYVAVLRDVMRVSVAIYYHDGQDRFPVV